MNILRKTVLGVSGALLGLSLVAGQAQAVQLTGSIGLTGTHTPVDAANTPTTLGAATGFDILTAQVDTTSGDFLGLATIGGAVTHNDFQFNPGNVPINPLWNLTIPTHPSDLSFDLGTINLDFQNANSVTVSGTGVFHATGYDDTPGTWVFSANGFNPGSFTFSSSNIAQPVPEPSILALLGLGLLGFFGGRRLNKKV